MKSRRYVYFPLSVIYSVHRDALFQVSSSWRNFISYESFVWSFFFFFFFSLKANDIFSSSFVILSTQWPELILIDTLHHTECKSLSFDTSNFTHLPKRPTITSSEEWSMILHTTYDNFLILKHKRLKGNGKKSNIDPVYLPYGHT